jgi:N6-adenosine-specific RNA methylase IME4
MWSQIGTPIYNLIGEGMILIGERQPPPDSCCSTPPFPPRRYGLLLADPASQFRTRSPKGMGRAAENHYATMSPDEIMALPVGDIAEKDAVLFLWAVACMLLQALNTMTSWGFRYRSQQVWVKPSIGLGFWFRGQHELLLVGSRGRFRIGPASAPSSVITAPRRKHSQKPDEVHEDIQRRWPDLSKIELFARNSRPGWDAWGLEAPVA